MTASATYHAQGQDHNECILTSGMVAHKWLCDSPRAILILQHGFGEYAERYVYSNAGLILELTAANFEVWALDLQGHGRSPGDRGIVNVIMAVQDHIELRQQAATHNLPIFLFGHSLGGLVTAASITEGGPALRVDGVILSGPALPGTMARFVEGIIRVVARLIPSLQIPKQRSPIVELCRDPEQVRLAREDERMYQGQISFTVASSALQAAKAMWSKLDQWTAPTLVFHGTADSYTDHRQSEHFVERIASAKKTLNLVEGGYHELLNEPDPKDMIQLMLQWLDSCLQSLDQSASLLLCKI